MKVSKNIPPALLQGATAMLASYIPELSPTTLAAALEEFKGDTPQRRESMLKKGEACRILGVAPATLDRYLRDGLLHRVKVGTRLVRIAPAEVDALLRQSTQQPGAGA